MAAQELRRAETLRHLSICVTIPRCGQIGTTEPLLAEYAIGNIVNTEAYQNIGVTNRFACGSYTDYAYTVYGTVASTVVYNNWGYSATGTNQSGWRERVCLRAEQHIRH